MKITVKRNLWIFAAFMPVRLKFNGEPIATLYGSQERILSIPTEEGKLEYSVPIGRNSKLHVNSDDIITIEESVLGKILSVMFVFLMLYWMTQALGIWSLTSFSNYETLFLLEKNIFGVILIVALISLFLKMYKLEKENS